MSAENEIRNVQLFTNLISLKQDLFDSVHPVGEIYVQYPAQSDPNTIYNKNGVVSTWTEQNYAGSFFRASGGNADAFQSTGETSGLSKQSQTIQQHKHAIGGYTGYTQPSFTGLPVNTNEKGGHSHTTNSLTNNSGTAITNTGEMSKNPTGMCTAIPRAMDMWNDNPKWSGNMWWEDGGHGTWSKSGASQGMMVEGYLKNDVSHVHDMQHKHGTDTQGSHTHSVTANGTIENHRHSLPSNTSNTGDIETRPENLTIKIWKRTA